MCLENLCLKSPYTSLTPQCKGSIFTTVCKSYFYFPVETVAIVWNESHKLTYQGSLSNISNTIITTSLGVNKRNFISPQIVGNYSHLYFCIFSGLCSSNFFLSRRSCLFQKIFTSWTTKYRSDIYHRLTAILKYFFILKTNEGINLYY